MASTKRFNPLTKIRVNTQEMMNYVKGKRMEESDLCMMLEDMGVVLDKATWTHFKDVFAQTHENEKLVLKKGTNLNTLNPG